MNIKRYLKKYLKPNRYFPHVADGAYVSGNARVYNKNNLIMEEDTGIGPNAIIMNTNAKYIMHRHSGASVNLVVITGNHAMVVGRFYRTISKEKDYVDISKYDKDVIVDEDVWIGANVTLLSGVHICRGSVVAAGAVVTKDMPPYCIIGGVPAKPIKLKWSIEDILKHESILYKEDERFSEEELKEIYSRYPNLYQK